MKGRRVSERPALFPFSSGKFLIPGTDQHMPLPLIAAVALCLTVMTAQSHGADRGENSNKMDEAKSATDKPARDSNSAPGVYTRAILESRPLAYWRLEESTPEPVDCSGDNLDAIIEGAVSANVPGVGNGAASSAFSGTNAVNRAFRFAGGRFRFPMPYLGENYSVEFWFWNDSPTANKEVVGSLFTRGSESDSRVNGDHLAIAGGSDEAVAGKLIFYNNKNASENFAGSRVIRPQSWHHVVVVRQGGKVTVYLDGKVEIEAASEVSWPKDKGDIFLGGRSDNFSNLEGKLDEIAVYDRVLGIDEVSAHFRAAALPGK